MFKIVFIVPIIVMLKPPEIQKITRGDLVKLTVIARIEQSFNLQYQWLFKDKKYNIKPSL